MHRSLFHKIGYRTAQLARPLSIDRRYDRPWRVRAQRVGGGGGPQVEAKRSTTAP